MESCDFLQEITLQERERAEFSRQVTVLVLIGVAIHLRSVPGARKHSQRRRSRRRGMARFMSNTRGLHDVEFHRAFRMSRGSFDRLLSKLGPELTRDQSQGLRSCGGSIEPACRLAIAVRILAGASYVDIMLAFRLAKSTVYAVFKETILAIGATMQLPGIPFDDEVALRKCSIQFITLRNPPSPLHGCVGAVDGLLLHITKPADRYNPAHYFCRKGFYAIPLQVVCDSN
jgi:hypothetical protein